MKISTQSRYAIRMLLELSLQENDTQRLTAQQIALRQGISEKYLESIATKLQKGGFLHSSKGFGGGYRLALAPAEIRLGDIMRLMETNFFASHCVKDPEKNCKHFTDCITYEYLCQIEQTLSQEANSISINDLRNRYHERKKSSLKPSEYNCCCSVDVDMEDVI